MTGAFSQEQLDAVPEAVKRMTAPLTCGGCLSTWSGLGRAHCGVGGCHRTFTGVTAFDRHRSSGGCANPVDLGMVLRDGGIWGAPAMTPEQAAEIWKKGDGRG
jgi:hypothetical protein